MLVCLTIHSNLYSQESCFPDQYPFCDGSTPLQWDSVNSVKEIANNSSGTVRVTGGNAPYTWTISGTGFSFSGGEQMVTTSEPQVEVYADSTACGTANINVTESCSTVDGSFRSTTGVWIGNAYAYSLYIDYGDTMAWTDYSSASVEFSDADSCIPVFVFGPYDRDFRVCTQWFGFYIYKWSGSSWVTYGSIGRRAYMNYIVKDTAAGAYIDAMKAGGALVGTNNQPSIVWPNGPSDGYHCGNPQWTCP